MNTYNVPTNIVKALFLFTAKKDRRLALTGICLQCENGVVRLTAACGATLATWNCVVDSSTPSEEIIIPNDIIKAGLAAFGKTSILTISRESFNGLNYEPIKVPAPPFKNAWPKDISEKPIKLDPELFARIGHANKALGLPTNHFNDWHMSNMSIIFDNGQIRGMIMGVREESTNTKNFPAF